MNAQSVSSSLLRISETPLHLAIYSFPTKDPIFDFHDQSTQKNFTDYASSLFSFMISLNLWAFDFGGSIET